MEKLTGKQTESKLQILMDPIAKFFSGKTWVFQGRLQWIHSRGKLKTLCFFVALNSCSLFCAKFEKNRQQFVYNEGFAWLWENLLFWILIFYK